MNDLTYTIFIELAHIQEFSLDYLVGTIDTEIDAKTLHRVVELQKLPSDVREKLYFFIDMSIRDFKAKAAYALSILLFRGLFDNFEAKLYQLCSI